MKEPRDGAADGADRTVQDCSFVELDFKGDKLVLPVEFTVYISCAFRFSLAQLQESMTVSGGRNVLASPVKCLYRCPS